MKATLSGLSFYLFLPHFQILENYFQVMLASALPGEKVSSSVIRRLLSQGDVTGADELLGRPYRLTGMVRGGHRVGRLLGFPTANISLPAGKLIPAGGVYAVRVQLPDGE